MVTVWIVVGMLSVEAMVTIVPMLTGLNTVWMEAVVVIVDVIVPGTTMQKQADDSSAGDRAIYYQCYSAEGKIHLLARNLASYVLEL